MMFPFKIKAMCRFLLLMSSIVLFSCQQTDTSFQSAENITNNKTSLLDEDLTHFNNIYNFGTADYKDGVLTLGSTGNLFYLTKNQYKDFILHAEVLMPDVSEYSNAGIIFRAQIKETEKGRVAIGYQAEIDPSPRKWSGGLYDQGRRQWLHPIHKTRSNLDEKFEKNYLDGWTPERADAYKHLAWNSYRIEAIGSDIKIYVNDVLTTHVRDTTDAEGYIGLQHHGSEKLRKTGATDNLVKYRNVFIEQVN